MNRLDTDSTPNLEGAVLHKAHQAEGVANLDRVPETSALVAIGYLKFKGLATHASSPSVLPTGDMAYR